MKSRKKPIFVKLGVEGTVCSIFFKERRFCALITVFTGYRTEYAYSHVGDVVCIASYFAATRTFFSIR